MSSSSNTGASAGPSSRPNDPTDSSNPAPGTGGPEAGQKRTAGERESPFEEPTATKKRREAAVRKPKPYQFKPTQIPKEFIGTRDAAHTHGYILYGITRSDAAPAQPSDEHIARFNLRYVPGFIATLEDRLRKEASEHSGAAAMVKFLRTSARENARQGCNIASNILGINEAFLLAIYSAVLNAGLEFFLPDLLSPPDTIYNQIHELVFIQTFRIVCAGFAYKFVSPTTSAVNNNALLVSIYHNFLYAYMRGKTKLGTARLLKNKEDNNTSRRRKTLCQDRVRFSLVDKQPPRVITMISDPHAHSDDESASDGEGNEVHLINEKGPPGPRSESATTWLRVLDPRRKKLKRSMGRKGKKEERKRRAGDDAVVSDLSYQIPKTTTIDWFDPAYFNDLPAGIRFNYAKTGVALPLVQFHGNKDWKTMDDATFMAKYGNDVLAQYEIPTQEEMDMQPE
ncbi:hypothetical protein C8R43DRAFT_1124237 [Mycena crocata]|nr:hypothetical protein C8R43DRAFT_1124237 [Mycena crocata]